MAAQSVLNRQGRAAPMDPTAAEAMRKVIVEDAERSFAAYNWLLNEDEQGNMREPDRPGLSRELARIGLGLNTYTQWYWKTDLHNLLHFLRLRADPHAQYEIRIYAEAILAIVAQWVPITHQAFVDYRLGAFSLSAAATELVRRMLAGEVPTFESSGLSKREWDELDEKLRFTH